VNAVKWHWRTRNQDTHENSATSALSWSPHRNTLVTYETGRKGLRSSSTVIRYRGCWVGNPRGGIRNMEFWAQPVKLYFTGTLGTWLSNASAVWAEVKGVIIREVPCWVDSNCSIIATGVNKYLIIESGGNNDTWVKLSPPRVGSSNLEIGDRWGYVERTIEMKYRESCLKVISGIKKRKNYVILKLGKVNRSAD
jgi:hypothetical protein